jgi:hypothetical protein
MWSVLDFVGNPSIRGFKVLICLAQVVPGLVGTHTQWKNAIAKKVDRGMDQNATVADVYNKRVSISR